MPRITIQGAFNHGHAYSQTTVTEITSRRDASGNVENTFRQIQHNSGATPQFHQPTYGNAQDWVEPLPAYNPRPALAYSQSRAAGRPLEQAPTQGLVEYYPPRNQSQHTGGSRRPSQGQLGRSRSVREPIYEHMPADQVPPAQHVIRRGSARETRCEYIPEPDQPTHNMPRRGSVRESRREYAPEQVQPVQYIYRDNPDDEHRRRSRRPSQGQRDYNDPEYEDPSRSRARSRAPSAEPPRQLMLVRRDSRRSERQ